MAYKEWWKTDYYEEIVRTSPEGTVHLCLDQYNKRVRLDHYDVSDAEALSALEEAAPTVGATKLIAKIRPESLDFWIAYGYVPEGKWDGYFRGMDGIGVSRFLQAERRHHPGWDAEDQFIRQLLKRGRLKSIQTEPATIRTEQCTADDADALSILYQQVFQAYPTPVHDPDYIRHRMSDGAIVRCIRNEREEIISAATIEWCRLNANGEITDCATRPDARGKGYTKYLIEALETDSRNEGLLMLYALSRAGIPAINSVLSDLGYLYRGRFANNCRMDSGYENMNLWIKKGLE